MLSLTSHMLHLGIICSIRVARVHSMSMKRTVKTSLLYGALHSSYNQFGNSIFNIFCLLIIHSHDRTSSITRVHTTTWDYFTDRLADRFRKSSIVVKEEIMTDINDLVQEFWTSRIGAIETFFIAMRSSRLLKILQECLDSLEDDVKVCFDIISFFATAVDLADNNLQTFDDDGILEDIRPMRDKFTILLDGYRKTFDQYRKMFDQSLSNSKDLGDMLRFLPGIVVQKNLSMQGMADLYRIKPVFLERLIKPIELLLRPSGHGLYYPRYYPRYILDDYLSGFLQDRDRSQHYYCDPKPQHTSICRQILSLLDQSNVFDSQS